MREAPPPVFRPSCQHSGSRTFVRIPSNSGLNSVEILSPGLRNGCQLLKLSEFDTRDPWKSGRKEPPPQNDLISTHAPARKMENTNKGPEALVKK